MAGNLLNTYITGFDRAIRETVEVKGGKMRPYVNLATGDLFRKEGIYQRTSGGGIPSKVVSRFGDSPVSDIDYSRRRTTRTAYHDGQFMDWADLSKMGIDPRSVKLGVMKNKFLRQEDLIIDAAMLGSASGATTSDTFAGVAFGNGLTNNSIIDDDTGASDSGFNYTKFVNTLGQFGNQSVDIESQQVCFKVSWNQWKDIINDSNFTDFEKRGTLGSNTLDRSAGVIYDYMGCHFIVSNILPYATQADPTAASHFNIDIDVDVDTSTGVWKDTDSSATRIAYAFVKDAVLLEINPDITTKIDERADKSFNYYAYMKMELGAVRMEEEKVIAIACHE